MEVGMWPVSSATRGGGGEQRPEDRRLRTRSRRLLVAALICLGGCRAAARPNVLLVTLDTTRPDRLGCYGYTRAATPNLDRFAETASLYERAYSTSSWTLPSHASLFTGLLPMQHGAQTTPKGAARQLGYGVRPLAESFTTLAETLGAAGYRTAGVVGGPALSRELGIAQGFERYDDALDGPGEKLTGKRAEAVADRAIAYVESFGDAPYFLFVNFFDPHAPYRPPPPYDRGLAAEDSASQAELLRELLRQLDAHAAPVPPDRLGTRERQVLDALRAGYDAEIHYMDHHLGRLLDAVARSARAAETLIVITGDHGESFGEHYFISHGAHLYEDNVRVPLVVRPAGAASPSRVREPVQNHRLFASILEAVGLPLPAGVALRGLAAPGGAIVTEVGRSDANVRLFGAVFDRDLRAIYAPPWKLIEASPGLPELFDIARDSEELVDLATRSADVGGPLAERLDEIVRLHPPLYDATERALLDQDTEDALRALGYLE
jgi:arylsulfatase A-like enzyme